MKELLEKIGILYNAINQQKEDSPYITELLLDIDNQMLACSKQAGYNPDEKDPIIEGLTKQSVARLKELEEKKSKEESVSFLTEQMVCIEKQTESFWKEAGFNFVDSVCIEHGVVEIKFKFSLNYGSFASVDRISSQERDRMKKAELVEKGYCLDEKQRELLDCDINKEKIEQVIKARFPSSRISSWESVRRSLRQVIVRVTDLQDFLK